MTGQRITVVVSPETMGSGYQCHPEGEKSTFERGDSVHEALGKLANTLLGSGTVIEEVKITDVQSTCKATLAEYRGRVMMRLLSTGEPFDIDSALPSSL